MNIHPTSVSSREVSATLLELASELLDVGDKSDEKQIIQTQLINCYMAHFRSAFQLIITGSTTEHTKLKDRLIGSDLDIMVFPTKIKVGKDSLEYNKSFPCFVRVNANVAQQLGRSISGEYLQTSFLRNMEFLDGNMFPLARLFLEYAMYHRERLYITSESSVGLKLNWLFRSSVSGMVPRNSDEEETEVVIDSRTISNALENAVVSDQISNIHKKIDSYFENSYNNIFIENISSWENKTHDTSICLGLSTSCDKSTKEQDGETRLPVSFKSQCNTDIVPGLMLDGWPTCAIDWITRTRIWPSKESIKFAVDQGVSIVTKPLPVNPNEELDFRLSFSLAEKSLAEAMNETQRLTVVIAKACNKLAGPADLVSYHIKTALYWISENKLAAFWRLDNLSACVKCLIGYLLSCVRRQFLPHYFIPDMNLFAGFDDDSFHEMEEKLLSMYHKPLQFVQGFIKRGNNIKDGVHILNGNNRHVLRNPASSSIFTAKKMVYKQCMHELVDHLFAVSNQQMSVDDLHNNLAKLVACRSQMAKLGRSQSDIENIIFQLVTETKDYQDSQSLLKEFVKLLSKDHTED